MLYVVTAQTGDLESLYSGIHQVKLAVSRFPLSLERDKLAISGKQFEKVHH